MTKSAADQEAELAAARGLCAGIDGGQNRGVADPSQAGHDDQPIQGALHFAANELEERHQCDVVRLRLRRTLNPTNAENCRFDCNGTQLLCGRRCHSTGDGPVNSSTSSTTTGVTKSEIKNVPKKPMRRWLPQSPVRTQNTDVQNNGDRLGHYVAVSLSIMAPAPPDRDPRHGQRAEADIGQGLVAAALLLDVPRVAGAG